jgi:uncharacterized protein (UPF0332 family)
MSYKFQNCVNNRSLRRCPIDGERAKREILEAKKDLESAKASLFLSDDKWAIIKAYFSMFHAFRSLLFRAGYTEKSHECLIIAVEELFIENGKLPSSIVNNIRNAKTAREAADYGCTYGPDTARGAVQDAEEAYRIVEEYIKTG